MTVRRYSTLFGVATTIVLTVVIGWVSHWSAILMIAAGILGIALFPRLFYGFAASRALNKERGSGSGGLLNNSYMWDARPTDSERLDIAMNEAEGFGPRSVPDADALQRLAKEARN